MVKRKVKICPITGDEIVDRKYNKKANYSKDGYKIMRKHYMQEWNRTYYLVKKIAGIGLISISKEKINASRSIGKL